MCLECGCGEEYTTEQAVEDTVELVEEASNMPAEQVYVPGSDVLIWVVPEE